jgi:hypothetical protein
MDPEPVPLPAGEVTEIETTVGVTRAEIALAFMPVLPISTRLRFVGHVPVEERKRAPVRLSAHAVMTDVGVVVAAVATPPAMITPARNALATFVDPLTLMLFILTILYLDAEITL